GDGGDTGLFGGQRVLKSDLRVQAYGAVDELNASLGLLLTLDVPQDIRPLILDIQSDLFVLGADLATPITPENIKNRSRSEQIVPDQSTSLENAIDLFESELEPLQTFILPGGSGVAAQMHISRTVCRRAERDTVEMGETESLNPECVRYLNRLSDLLFVLARVTNSRVGIPDVPWKPS
ncbi:MAG: cob(I)yrinic acid a,c-diamide adenosyltransferase, partial [Chthonomonadales bacterium]